MWESQQGHALTIGDQGQVVPLAFADQKTEERLRTRLSGTGKAMSVRITPAEQSDVEGHALDATQRSVFVKLQLDEDDTEGHAISLHFPTAADADKFRRNLLVAGLLAGSIVVGSAGAIAISSHPAAPGASAPTVQSQVFERPAGRGFLQGADMTTPATTAAGASSISAATGIDPATGKPAQSGFQERADAGSGPADTAPAGSQTVQRPAGSGPLEGADR